MSGFHIQRSTANHVESIVVGGCALEMELYDLTGWNVILDTPAGDALEFWISTPASPVGIIPADVPADAFATWHHRQLVRLSCTLASVVVRRPRPRAWRLSLTFHGGRTLTLTIPAFPDLLIDHHHTAPRTPDGLDADDVLVPHHTPATATLPAGNVYRFPPR